MNIDSSIFYVLVPFQYKGAKIIDRYIEQIGKSNCYSFSNKEIGDDFFLGYINETFKRCSVFEIQIIDSDLNLEIYCFDTNVGFFVSKLEFDNKEYNSLLSMMEETQKFANSLSEYTNDTFAKLIEKMSQISIFPAGSNKKCLILGYAISKINSSDLGKIKNDNIEIYKIDKLHECYISSDNFLLITNQHFSNIDTSGEREAEELFRKRYEENLLKVFLMLHHERQMYLVLRKQIVSEQISNSKAVRKTKKQIIELLTCFSYKIVTEDKEFQTVYQEYRNVLGLTEYESTLSDLVFRLDDEIDKVRDKKINFVSLIIGVLGLLQLVSVIMDIVGYFIE